MVLADAPLCARPYPTASCFTPDCTISCTPHEKAHKLLLPVSTPSHPTPHFTDEETEAHRGSTTHMGSLSWPAAGPGLSPRRGPHPHVCAPCDPGEAGVPERKPGSVHSTCQVLASPPTCLQSAMDNKQYSFPSPFSASSVPVTPRRCLPLPL